MQRKFVDKLLYALCYMYYIYCDAYAKWEIRDIAEYVWHEANAQFRNTRNLRISSFPVLAVHSYMLAYCTTRFTLLSQNNCDAK